MRIRQHSNNNNNNNNISSNTALHCEFLMEGSFIAQHHGSDASF